MVTGGDGAAQVHLAHRAKALRETSVCSEHSMTLLFSQLLICIVCVCVCVCVCAMFGKNGASFVSS